MNNVIIVERLISSLRPYSRNARTHSHKQLNQIAASIKSFGFTNPILIDQYDMIIAGHGRVEAAKLLNLQKVPTIRIEHLNEPQKRAYILADNKIAANAGWDPEILAIELAYLSSVDLELDVEVTGFAVAEIDFLIDGQGSNAKPDDPADKAPATEAFVVSAPGDIWVLGDHKIICGDARHPDTVTSVMGWDKARLMFADPPYNVPIQGIGGLGSIKHREFSMASGEMSKPQFTAFLTTIFSHAASVSLDGAIHFICMDWRHLGETLIAGEAVYSEFKNLCVWNKDNGGMGSFYRSKHELIFVFKIGSKPHVNTFELGQTGRYRTNVWDYAGVNTFRPGRLEDLSMHPTVKPVAMVLDAIKDTSRRGEIVLDPFGGSGTTLMAAEKSGRRSRLIEVDPAYVDVTIRRWQEFTGKSAIHAGSGSTFQELNECRATANVGTSNDMPSAVRS